jgi:hypothetical protein
MEVSVAAIIASIFWSNALDRTGRGAALESHRSAGEVGGDLPIKRRTQAPKSVNIAP